MTVLSERGGATIRTLAEADVNDAVRLSAGAGWNQTEDDWRMLLRLAPDGCFGIETEGRLVATTSLITYGKTLGWIGMVLTDANYQRRGFARALVQHAIDRADASALETLKLDATVFGRTLYESVGFRAEQPVERWRSGAALQPTGAVEPQEPALAIDYLAYGADRTALLQALAGRSHVLEAAQGFAMLRSGARCSYLGPCLAEDEPAARRLVRSCLEGRGKADCFWDLLPLQPRALHLAEELGFVRERELVRMVRGRELRGREEYIYSIAGFEFG